MFRFISVIVVAITFLSACGSASSGRSDLVETKKVQPASGLQKCSDRYALLRAPQIDTALSAKQNLESSFGAQRLLGVEENVTVLPADGTSGAILRVRYPEGSINFGSAKKGRPLGGASFYVPYFRGRSACLHYRVRFQDDFAFQKGGKLPGLYDGSAPSGGEAVTGKDGWSIRLMWRKKGAGELYEYVVNKKGKYGASVGRGLFHFVPGRWMDIDLEVTANDPGQRNGIARLWVDGRPVIEQDDIVYNAPGGRAGNGGLMFSTFFGGNGKSWASPKDQYVDFADFRFYGEGGKR